MIVLVDNFDFYLFVCIDIFGHKIILWMLLEPDQSILKLVDLIFIAVMTGATTLLGRDFFIWIWWTYLRLVFRFFWVLLVNHTKRFQIKTNLTILNCWLIETTSLVQNFVAVAFRNWCIFGNWFTTKTSF